MLLAITWGIILFWYFSGLIFLAFPIFGIWFAIRGGKINV